MIGVDTNIIVYANRVDLPQHKQGYEIIKKLSSDNIPWAIAWPSLYEFFRLVTHPKVFKKPSSRSEAFKVIKYLHTLSSLTILAHGNSHLTYFEQLADSASAIGNFAFDVQIASIFLEHGIEEIITNDSDFLRFRQLKITNPFDS